VVPLDFERLCQLSAMYGPVDYDLMSVVSDYLRLLDKRQHQDALLKLQGLMAYDEEEKQAIARGWDLLDTPYAIDMGEVQRRTRIDYYNKQLIAYKIKDGNVKPYEQLSNLVNVLKDDLRQTLPDSKTLLPHKRIIDQPKLNYAPVIRFDIDRFWEDDRSAEESSIWEDEQSAEESGDELVMRQAQSLPRDIKGAVVYPLYYASAEKSKYVLGAVPFAKLDNLPIFSSDTTDQIQTTFMSPTLGDASKNRALLSMIGPPVGDAAPILQKIFEGVAKNYETNERIVVVVSSEMSTPETGSRLIPSDAMKSIYKFVQVVEEKTLEKKKEKTTPRLYMLLPYLLEKGFAKDLDNLDNLDSKTDDNIESILENETKRKENGFLELKKVGNIDTPAIMAFIVL